MNPLVFEQQAAVHLERLGLTVAGEYLDTVCQQAAAGGWSYSHFLGYLLDGEMQERHRKTVKLNLQFARFPYQKRLGDFDFTAQPGLDRRLIDELATGRFLSEGRNVVFLGPPGVGKTHIAISLGVITAEMGHRVYCQQAFRIDPLSGARLTHPKGLCLFVLAVFFSFLTIRCPAVFAGIAGHWISYSGQSWASSKIIRRASLRS